MINNRIGGGNGCWGGGEEIWKEKRKEGDIYVFYTGYVGWCIADVMRVGGYWRGDVGLKLLLDCTIEVMGFGLILGLGHRSWWWVMVLG